jgi:colanic acid/amylovoran biosynthesis glycosyltransferase
MKPIIMIHANDAIITDGVLHVDRKFHTGMCRFVDKIKAPLISVHPRSNGRAIMDGIRIPIIELPYGVQTMEVDKHRMPTGFDKLTMARLIRGSSLVYGDGLGAPSMAKQSKVPYILLLEYDLPTRLIQGALDAHGLLRKGVRMARIALRYFLQTRSAMSGAHSIHCNGYPVYEIAKGYNDRCLLYLDSRISTETVISAQDLESRLARKGPLRLLYSGRYERLKGADAAVEVAVECLRRGLDVEMDCYGQGSLKQRMLEIAGAHAGYRIRIHDAIPSTELAQVARTCDLFVCCHVQSDPSCTYLESMGAGLPIFGYANRMWKDLCEASGAGVVAPANSPQILANIIERSTADLARMSRCAQKFSLAHAFDIEHDKRIHALNEALEDRRWLG